MALYDLSGDALRSYRCSTPQPGDLDEFWSSTLAEARALAVPVRAEPVDTGLPLVRTHDVTFSGFGGDPVRAWWHVPVGVAGPLPVVVHVQGYGGGRGLAHQVPWFVLAGWACLEVDTRGQGSGYSPGDTDDPWGSGPAHPGYLTRGVLDPREHYYRRVFTDAVLAVDAVAELPDADPQRVAVAGGSQGGGIALAVAALHPGLRAVSADVPFLCDFRRGSEVAVAAPYTEITAYLSVHRDQVEQVFATLAYVDAAVLASRARAPALLSVALMDRTCPPSTVYAAYNAYGGAKRIVEYPFNDHEGGQGFHDREVLDFLREHLRR
jgi:cephalosporin-C deacetylase